MSQLGALLRWILKAGIFFTLFAFTLNNQGDVTVRFFFGRQWTGPLILVVLCAFCAGLLLGVLGMIPRWWKQRRAAARAARAAAAAPTAPANPTMAPAADVPRPVAAPAHSTRAEVHGV